MNTQEISKLSDDNLRRKIAEARGWTNMIWTSDGNVIGKAPGAKQRDYPPNQPTDMNAAVELLKEMPEYFLTWNGRWVICEIFDAPSFEFIIAQHTNPARAICEAWYAWHLAQEKEAKDV